jgi:hypothetical protein
MPIQQGLTTIYKQAMLRGEYWTGTAWSATFAIKPRSDTIRMALYTAFSDIGPNTTVYTPINELPNANGYTTGGNRLTGVTITADANGVAYMNFDNVSWLNANFTARGALIYDDTRGNMALAVIDFGSDKVFTSTSNTVTMPANTATTALIRLP